MKRIRHITGASAAARFIAAAALIVGGALALAATLAPAQAYSGSQAEAQSDPRTADPYSFPNIQLCCQKKRSGHRRRHGGGYGGGPGGGNGGYDPDYPPPGKTLRVSCGAPQRYSYSSVGEALEHAREGWRIVVAPGAPCDVSGLVIDQGVRIETDDYAYGARASLQGDECMSISPGYSSSVVSFHGIDIEGCMAVQSGRLDFNEVNLASRGGGDAVRLNGGSFSSTDSTIRARGTAVNAERGVMVSLTGGGFASAARAEYTIKLNVDGATLQNTVIKGGATGAYVGMAGRYPVAFRGVQVIRGEANEIYQVGPGRAGVVVGGVAPGDDLPSLPNLPGVSFTMDGGVIAGYADGLVLASGTRAQAKGVNIAYPARGIVVAAGAAVDLRENRINHSKRVGIDLAGGALGTASFNDIQCDDGRCVCYDGDCTSRADREFGHGAFRMSGTRCND